MGSGLNVSVMRSMHAFYGERPSYSGKNTIANQSSLPLSHSRITHYVGREQSKLKST